MVVTDPTTTTQQVQDLQNLAHETQTILAQTKTVFPLQLFPTVLTVDKMKVEYTHYDFLSRVMESFLITDVSSVRLESSIFTATIEIVTKLPNPTQSVIRVPFLELNSALLVAETIQGLVVSAQRQMDVVSIPAEDLLQPVQSMGSSKATSPVSDLSN